MVLPPNPGGGVLGWADDEADIWLTDVPQHAAFSGGLMPGCGSLLENMPSEYEPEHAGLAAGQKAQARLKTSGSSGAAQVVVENAGANAG